MNLPLWWPSTRTLVGIGVGVLVLIALGGGTWFWYSAQQERGQGLHAEALARAAQARASQAPAATKASAMTALDGALTAASSAPLAAQSAYALGDLRFDGGDYAAARAAYGVALAKTTSPTVRTLARAAIAASWEAERKFPEAIVAYTAALAADKDAPFYAEDLLIGLARSHELAGQKDVAIQTYERVLKEVPKAKLRRESEVRGRLASLAPPS